MEQAFITQSLFRRRTLYVTIDYCVCVCVAFFINHFRFIIFLIKKTAFNKTKRKIGEVDDDDDDVVVDDNREY